MASSARFGAFAAVLSLSACVFDPHGSRQDTTSTGQGGATSSASVGPGGATSSVATGTGAGGALALCGDAIVETPETCETGDVPFASCVSCMIVHTCGNGVVEPGEACDESSANCNSCQVSGGACFGVDPLAMTLTPTPATTQSATALLPGDFDDAATPCALASQTRAVRVYRFDVGPYPSGLFVSATGDTNLDPVLWAFDGCTKTPLSCNDIDPDPLGVSNNTAYLNLPLAAPGSVLFVAVGDRGNQTGAYHFIAAPTRFFEDFEGSLGQFTATGSWLTSTHYVSMSNPPSDADLVSSDIDVVGLTDLQVAVVHNLSAGATASVVVVPNGGGPTSQAILGATPGSVAGASVNLTIPPGTSSAKLHLHMAQGSGYWEIHRVLLGPKP